MSEYVISSIMSAINSFLKKRLDAAIKNQSWVMLFADSGDALIQYLENEGAFVEDLRLVFTKENMKKLAKRLEKEPGTSLPDLLHDELVALLLRYEVEEDLIETCVFHFSNEIIQYIRKNNPDKALGQFLNEWEKKLTRQLERIEQVSVDTNKIVRQLASESGLVYSIQDIENKLKKDSSYSMNLSFFDLDDDAFKDNFDMAVSQQQTMIHVEGKSKEETLYRVLNEIKQQYPRKKHGLLRMKKRGKNLMEQQIRF